MAQTITRTFPDGDYPTLLSAAYQAWDAARQDEEKHPPTLLNGELAPSETLLQEYLDLKDEAERDAAEKRRIVKLRAIGRREWRPLREKHPPRAGEGVEPDVAKSDRLAGVNIESVEDDLVFASVIEPEFTSRGDFDEWSNDLSEGEWQTLVTTAWQLVNVAQFDPKSPRPSRTLSDGES